MAKGKGFGGFGGGMNMQAMMKQAQKMQESMLKAQEEIAQMESTGTAGGNGFTAIIVAWLAKFNTFTMALISFLLIFLNKGAAEIASAYNLNDFASDIIAGIILFFILGCEFFINFKVGIRSKRKEAGAKLS